MKKIFIGLVGLFFLFFVLGCGRTLNAREVVDNYLNMYITLDSRVVSQLDELASKEYDAVGLKDLYMDIMKSQYTTMHYQIVGERYDGDNAYITTRVTVRDLYKVQRDANSHLNNHSDEFHKTDGTYDEEKFLRYKLEEMDKTVDTTIYDIEFKLLKTDDTWEVLQLSNQDLEKIHGVYNYEA